LVENLRFLRFYPPHSPRVRSPR